MLLQNGDFIFSTLSLKVQLISLAQDISWVNVFDTTYTEPEHDTQLLAARVCNITFLDRRRELCFSRGYIIFPEARTADWKYYDHDSSLGWSGIVRDLTGYEKSTQIPVLRKIYHACDNLKAQKADTQFVCLFVCLFVFRLFGFFFK